MKFALFLNLSGSTCRFKLKDALKLPQLHLPWQHWLILQGGSLPPPSCALGTEIVPPFLREILSPDSNTPSLGGVWRPIMLPPPSSTPQPKYTTARQAFLHRNRKSTEEIDIAFPLRSRHRVPFTAHQEKALFFLICQQVMGRQAWRRCNIQGLTTTLAREGGEDL